MENPSVFKPETKYNSSISTLYSLGIVQGCDAQGNYHADWNITRAEAAAVVVRLALPDRRLPAPVSQDEANPSADREVKWAETDVSMCIPGNSYYRADQPADLLQEEEAHDKLTVSWTNGVPRHEPPMTQARCAVPELRFGYDSCGLVDVILLDAQELPEGSANLIVYDWDTRQIAAFLPLETLSPPAVLCGPRPHLRPVPHSQRRGGFGRGQAGSEPRLKQQTGWIPEYPESSPFFCYLGGL